MRVLVFKEWLDEAISTSQSKRIGELIGSYLHKKTGKSFAKMPGVEEWTNSHGHGWGIRFFYDGTKAIRFNWSTSGVDSAHLTSVDLWDGTEHDAKFSMQFEHAASLVATLPFVADFMLSPSELGKFFAIPADNLNESTEELAESYHDEFDEVILHFSGNGKNASSLSSREVKVRNELRREFASFFSGGGRGSAVEFTGGQTGIKVMVANKHKVLSQIGGVEVTVTEGGKNETYHAAKEIADMDANIDRLAYEDQLSDMKALIKLVIKGASNACFIAGRGGIGKTHTVEETLHELGLHDGSGYFKNTGSSSAAGLYGLMFKYKDAVLLFDDSDGSLADQDSRNLFKSATDTKKERKLVWNKVSSRLKDPDDITEDDLANGILPTNFVFTGKVIFISNLPINKLDPDGALRTRALMISIDPTDDEVLTFMEKICTKVPLEDGLNLSADERREVVVELRKSKQPGSVNIRKLVRALNIRAGDPKGNWQRLVTLYA